MYVPQNPATLRMTYGMPSRLTGYAPFPRQQSSTRNYIHTSSRGDGAAVTDRAHLSHASATNETQFHRLPIEALV